MTTPGRPAASETVRVSLDARAYDIAIGPGLTDRAGALISDLFQRVDAHLVTDANVARLYADRIATALESAGHRVTRTILPAGEHTKSFEHLETLVEGLIEAGAERRSVLIALGGGVIGDLVGFAAAILLRGVPFVQVPTTLLAQVDSSVGGKTAINSRHGKNLIGAFYQPRLVIADTDTLGTLPARELRAGYAEVVKYGLLGDAAFFGWLEGNAATLLAGDTAARIRAVRHCCTMKAEVVAEDEREAGRRALLNLGHTFGHALEAESGFGDALLHGEAVAIGTVLAFDLSARMGLCPPADVARVRRHFAATGLPTALPAHPGGGRWDAGRLVDHMGRDKKVRDGRPTFILVRGIGKAFASAAVDLADVEALLGEAAAAA